MKNKLDTLPVIRVPVRKRNPDFGKIPRADYYLPESMEDAEVLQLNVNAQTMRCRSPNKSWNTQDFNIKWFFDAYSIEKK